MMHHQQPFGKKIADGQKKDGGIVLKMMCRTSNAKLILYMMPGVGYYKELLPQPGSIKTGSSFH